MYQSKEVPMGSSGRGPSSEHALRVGSMLLALKNIHSSGELELEPCCSV